MQIKMVGNLKIFQWKRGWYSLLAMVETMERISLRGMSKTAIENSQNHHKTVIDGNKDHLTAQKYLNKI